MEYVLKTHSLTKTYKNVNAVDGINMSIPSGAIYGFVGRNGSGKTTLIRMVTGLIMPTSGNFSIYGVEDKRSLTEARRRIAAVVETPSIYKGMTARENLIMQCMLLGIDEEIIMPTLKIVGLQDTGDKKAKNFSLGMKQRLGIAVALIGSPDFLILDEPTNGLDPEGIVEIRELLIKLNRERGITILVSSHILGELSKIATHYGFISEGRLVKEISASELEHICRKRAHLVVNSTAKIPTVLSKFPTITEYKIQSSTELDIYGEVNVTDIVLALNEEGINVSKFSEHNEDLESFYINLIGGGRHV